MASYLSRPPQSWLFHSRNLRSRPAGQGWGPQGCLWLASHRHRLWPGRPLVSQGHGTWGCFWDTSSSFQQTPDGCFGLLSVGGFDLFDVVRFTYSSSCLGRLLRCSWKQSRRLQDGVVPMSARGDGHIRGRLLHHQTSCEKNNRPECRLSGLAVSPQWLGSTLASSKLGGGN